MSLAAIACLVSSRSFSIGIAYVCVNGKRSMSEHVTGVVAEVDMFSVARVGCDDPNKEIWREERRSGGAERDLPGLRSFGP